MGVRPVTRIYCGYIRIDGMRLAAPVLHAIEGNEVGSAHIVLLERFDRCRCRVVVIGDNVIQATTGCGYGYIILGINATQITQTSQDARYFALRLHAHKEVQDFVVGTLRLHVACAIVDLARKKEHVE